MSFDLFFRVRVGMKPPDRAALQGYFQRREYYQVSETQAFYQNKDTGVYFSFEFSKATEECPTPDWLPLALNVNYYRPHVFGLEAEIELREFIRAFDLLVSDPQNDGMGEGEYSSEGFLRGWNAGNRFAYQAILCRTDSRPAHVDIMPKDKIEYCWRWNYRRKDLQEQVAEVFVPTIMVLRHMGRLATVACWPDAIPVALPRVDLLLLGRNELLRPEQRVEGQYDKALVPSETFNELSIKHQNRKDQDDYVMLSYDVPPPAVLDFFRNPKSFVGKLEGIAFDQILDEQLVKECAQRRDKG
jgi:hypothetical protein